MGVRRVPFVRCVQGVSGREIVIDGRDDMLIKSEQMGDPSAGATAKA